MRGLWIKGRDGKILIWACTDGHQGVYVRGVGDFRWTELLPPAGTPIFRSRWHFRRWIVRRFKARGFVVADNFSPGCPRVSGPEPEGLPSIPPNEDGVQ